ncbi:hypothetical protein AOLI_G00050280 [Acnodon oligacanthus]
MGAVNLIENCSDYIMCEDVLNPSNCKLEGGRLPGVSSLQCSGSQLTREETKDFIWGEKRRIGLILD